MPIVFGIYNILIKTFLAHELGLTQEEQATMVFEVRQRVFHLFWIPVIPLYKIYTVTTNGSTYHVSAEVEAFMKQTKGVRTPWYSFALPLLAIVIGLGVYISDSIDASNREERAANEQMAFVNHTQELIKHPQKGDILVLTPQARWATDLVDFYSQKVLISLDEFKNNAFKSTATLINPSQFDHNEFTVENLFQLPDSIDFKTTEIVVSKNDLKGYLGKSSSNSGYYLTGGVAIFGNRFVVQEVLHRNSPNLFVDFDCNYNLLGQLRLSYYGPIARITKLEPLTGITGTPSYSKILANEDNMLFQHTIDVPIEDYTSDFTMRLTIQTETGIKYNFLISRIAEKAYARRVN